MLGALSKRKDGVMQSMLAWLYRRCGQMFCFGAGGALAFFAAGDYAERPAVMAASGGVLLFTGLGLKALSIWKAQNSN